MIDGSLDHQIKLGDVYRRLQPLFAYSSNIMSRISDPAIGIVRIVDHPSYISHLFTQIFDTLLVKLQEVCNHKNSFSLDSHTSGCRYGSCNISNSNSVSEVSSNFICCQDCFLYFLLFSFIW